MPIHSPTGANLNKVTGTEIDSIKRLAQMISMLNDELVAQGFIEPAIVKLVLAEATPELTRRAFTNADADHSHF